MRASMRRVSTASILLPLIVLATAGCDIVTADLKHTETAEWRKTYELQPGGSVEITNVNGRINVEPSTGNTVEIVATKTAKGSTPEQAREALARVQIVDNSGPSSVKVETKLDKTGGWFGSSGSVEYAVRVPSGGTLAFVTTNGRVEVRGISGNIKAHTTNGGVTAREIGGSIDAGTTNGGVDVEMTEVGEGGVRMECTNGGLTLRIPEDTKATISASVTNGGIDSSGLNLDTSESTRRRLRARLNGGGPEIRMEGTNGGIRISAR